MGSSQLLTASAGLKRVIVAKINPNKDLLVTIEELAIEKNIKSGIILSGVGSLKRAILRNLIHFPEHFPITAKNRLYKTIEGPLEILSLTGNILQREDGKLVVHAHICLSSVQGNKIVTLGGHLVEGCITYVKVEIAIAELRNMKLKRRLHYETKAWELSLG